MIRAGRSWLEQKSPVEEVVGGVGSGLVGLQLKGTLPGELLTSLGTG